MSAPSRPLKVLVCPDRFEEDEPGCWVWTGSVSPNGYGRVDKAYAHRLMFEEMVGPIPEGFKERLLSAEAIDAAGRVRTPTPSPGDFTEIAPTSALEAIQAAIAASENPESTEEGATRGD